MDLFKSQLDLASKVMSAQLAAHDVYSSNIANASMPNFKAKVPTFQIQLNQAQAAQQNMQALIDTANGTSQEPPSLWKVDMKVKPNMSSPNEIGNTVKPDREIINSSLNSMRYLTTLKLVNKQIALQKYAMTP